MADREYLEEVLEAGANKVRPVVERVMTRCRSAVGVGRP